MLNRVVGGLPAYLLLSFLALCVVVPVFGQSGEEYWDGRLGPPGVTGEVKAIAVSGDDVYVGGAFQRAGNLEVNNIARWSRTQHRWFTLGHGSSFNTGVNGEVLAITVDGGRIYVGGQFSHAGGIESGNIAVYDPATDNWTALGGNSSSTGSFISAIAVRGSDVFVGGSFAAIGTLLTNNVARWDGTAWQRLGTGVTGKVYTFAVVGNDLYVGGEIGSAGANQASNLVRWDGSNWSNVSSGTDGPVRIIQPVGGDLLIGGSFQTAGNVAARYIARYTTATGIFAPIGTGVGHPDPSLTPSVNAIVAVGNDLYIGGDFRTAGTDSAIARHIARWNGTEWLAMNQPGDTLGKGVGSNNSGFAVINAMVSTGGELYIGGRFDNAYMRTGVPQPAGDNVSEGYVAQNMVRWDLTTSIWRSLADAPNGPVRAMATIENGIVIGGRFSSAGGVSVRNVARWNYYTGVWTPLGAGTDTVTALAVSDATIYAGVKTDVLRWDGNAWMSLGASLPETVLSLAVVGSTIYAGTGGPTGGLYSWNGSAWAPVGGGINGRVLTISADKNGNVYAGGEFTMAGSVAATNIAQWTGTQWKALGSGTNGPVHSIGQGIGAIYVGGEFTTAGGAVANRVAQYDIPSSTWILLGTGLDATVRSVAYQQGTLYAAGDFVTTGGVTVRSIAQFDGEIWKEVGRGTNGPVRAMVIDNNSIFAAGSFDLAGITPSFGLARWSSTVASVNTTEAESIGYVSVDAVPNPVGSAASIRVTMTHAGNVSLRILDPLGQEIALLHDGSLSSGYHQFRWDASSSPCGMYFYQVQTNGRTKGGKIVVER